MGRSQISEFSPGDRATGFSSMPPRRSMPQSVGMPHVTSVTIVHRNGARLVKESLRHSGLRSTTAVQTAIAASVGTGNRYGYLIVDRRSPFRIPSS